VFDALPIPTPFQVGPVTAYLAERTLIDPGPDSDEAWAALVDALEARGLAPSDVERVLITHPHPDHFGIARRLRDGGADVLASEPTADIVGDFRARLNYEQRYFRPLLRRWGISADTVETTMQLPEAFLPYVEDVDVDRTLAAGDAVAVADDRLVVDTLQGHAVGEILFEVDPTDAGDPRTAIVGDHVLPTTTPNPFLQPPEEPDGERPHVLARYNESLARVRDRGFDRMLPGHGDPIEAPADRVDEILAAHEERTGNVKATVDGPTTPTAVMHDLFGDMPATEVFSGMSEAIGHLDLLEERGEVESRERGDRIVYERIE